MSGDFDLERFVRAQDPIMANVLQELRAGAKRTHWMWFVFPQLRALGRSTTAQHYGLASLNEAKAYLAHTILGTRLVQCTSAVMGVEGPSVHEIFGSPDDLKFRSSMTLFAAAQPGKSPFEAALVKFFDGKPDEATLQLIPAS